MPYPKGKVERPTKQLHVKLTPTEHRKLRLVAAHDNVEISEIVRSLVLPEITTRYDALGLGRLHGNGNGKGKGRSDQ